MGNRASGAGQSDVDESGPPPTPVQLSHEAPCLDSVLRPSRSCSGEVPLSLDPDLEPEDEVEVPPPMEPISEQLLAAAAAGGSSGSGGVGKSEDSIAKRVRK